MGKWDCVAIHPIFVSTFLVATITIYTCLGVPNITVACSEQERLALLKFKHSVVDDSKMLLSWVGNNCCKWEKIHCDNVTGNVRSLHLRADMGTFYGDGYYLVGNELNSSLAELNHLRYLDLSGNVFHGSRIPSFIGSLKQLTYLNLSYAGFQGIIPHHIGNLSNLKVLDLCWNQELIVDDMAWTFGLSSLEHLDLSSLDLSGAQNSDKMLGMIPSLKYLSLHSCELSNAGFSLFLNSSRILPNLKHLDLGFNSFKGPLPRFFQNMTSLEFLNLSNFNLSLSWNYATLLNMMPSISKLHLSNCGLDKTFLSSPHLNISTLSNIQYMDLSFNLIEGIFPSVLRNISLLRVLDLSYNMLNSSVPVMPNLLELHISGNEFKNIEDVGLWRHCHLKQLSVSGNHFAIEMIDSSKNVSECPQYAVERLYLWGSLNGTIPETLGRLTNLKGIDLSFNRLTGVIPESLGRLRFLEVLDLSDNQLTGPIPTFLGKLYVLDLSHNQLDGSIPESLSRIESLQVISMSSNLLNGAIPVSIGQLVNLRSLDISSNSLEGVVFETHFSNLSKLKHLDTSHNTKLTFNVSCEWIPPFKLVDLKIRSCNIANGFPHWLRNQGKLETLVLSNATISGPLPTWLQKMPIIAFMDLSHNKLSGPLTNLPNRENIDVIGFSLVHALLLENNLFDESIPSSLCNRKNLKFLDLSRNRLTGKLPKCLLNFQGLHTMILSSNRLFGVIPGITLNSSSLFQLKLNDNNFIGELPQGLGNLQDLSVLDLGDNEFTGIIPEWIGNKLTTLVVLRLHKNKFTGCIPLSLCKNSKLQILDVAFNNLTGTIPHCLGELNAMVNKSRLHLGGTPLDPDDGVIQVMKGFDLKYTTTWDIVFNMDLSSNKLVGEIPIKITELSMLMGLNLSNNHLSGGIPDSIGNMRKLESLDFSNNELIGMIPPSMGALNFLSHLNLSHNNLSGRIPIGSQLQTLIDPSIYVGNKDLCGAPLPNNCSNQKDSPINKKKCKEDHESKKVWLFYVDIISGFATGFWGVIGVLLFKKQWRHKLFMFAEETLDKIYDAIVVRVHRMKTEKEAT